MYSIRSCFQSVHDLVFLFFIIPTCIDSAVNITVLHTNDIHGRFGDTDQSGFTCDALERKENQCFGGIARIATVVKRIRRTEENVLLLDAGDRFGGTIWTEVYKGNATKMFVNELNYTALTLGNHDFDYGIPVLVHLLEGTKCATIVSNMNTSSEPAWPNNKQLIKKTKVVDLGGQKIGIVGYILTSTGRTSNSGPNIKFQPIIDSLQKAVNELESKGITKIIALGHAGFNVDKKVAQKVKGVDIVIGGHSNTFLFTGEPPSTEKPNGPYPYIVHPDYNKSLSVPVVQAFVYSKYLGHLQVTFNDEGQVTSWYGNPILMDHNVMKDQRVNDVVKKLEVLVDQMGEVKIGQSRIKLNGSNKICSTQQCVLGQVATAAMVYHFKSYNATIAVLNGNSIRSSLPTDTQGNVQYKDLFNSFPYWNTIDLVELSGADILESLQVSSFLQVKGLRVKYSSLKPSRRVQLLEVQHFPCTSSNNCYQPINMSGTYKVVVNSYLVTIGNKVIAKKARHRLRGIGVYEAIVNYFKDNSPIFTGIDTLTGTNTAVRLRNYYNLFCMVAVWGFLAALTHRTL